MKNKPTTLVCGHSGCLLCMAQTLLMTDNRCPECRAVHTTKLSVNVSLRQALQLLFPQEEQSTVCLPPQREQAAQLRWAVFNEEEASLHNLLLAGYNPNSRLPENGNNPLAHAAQFNLEIMASILLDFGAAVDLQDHDGDTALMNAVYFRNLPMVHFLLEQHGANPYMVSLSGMTALDYAKIPGHNGAAVDEHMVEVLEASQIAWDNKISTDEPDSCKRSDLSYEQEQGVDNDEEEYEVTGLKDGPKHMKVAAVAPLARQGLAPHSTPVARLAMGDEVLVVSYCLRNQVPMVKFIQGPVHCPEGWLPLYLPASNTRVLVGATDQEEEPIVAPVTSLEEDSYNAPNQPSNTSETVVE